MLSILRRRWLIWAGAIVVFLVVAGAVVLCNPWLTRCVESDRFRAKIENETAKGLHFPSGHYAPIRRTGFAAVESESFQASDGKKALKTMDARGLRAKFNPWGIFLRRWELDEVHIQSGEVGIQIYEANPEGVSSRPWFSIFLPNRVYLKRIESEPANVTWQFRGERAVFFGTRLLITPHGSDFEYRATGGTVKISLRWLNGWRVKRKNVRQHLAIDVRQPVPLLRQRQQRFGKEEQFLDPDGQLVSLRSKHVAAHSNRITQIQQVKQLKTALADNVLLYIHLDATSRSLQVGKSGLAHQPERYDPSGHAHFALVSLQCRSGRLAILLHQRRRRIRPAKLPRIRIVPQRRDLLELLLALFELVPRLKLQLEILSE